MTEPFSEVASIIDQINDRFYNHPNAGNLFIRPFQLLSDGDEIAVEFLGLRIFSSGDDEREDLEDGHGLEPLRPFLIRQANEFLENISAVRLEE